jgi:hypothetical protein
VLERRRGDLADLVGDAFGVDVEVGEEAGDVAVGIRREEGVQRRSGDLGHHPGAEYAAHHRPDRLDHGAEFVVVDDVREIAQGRGPDGAPDRVEQLVARGSGQGLVEELLAVAECVPDLGGDESAELPVDPGLQSWRGALQAPLPEPDQRLSAGHAAGDRILAEHERFHAVIEDVGDELVVGRIVGDAFDEPAAQVVQVGEEVDEAVQVGGVEEIPESLAALAQ